jgi:hypothetical protein
MTDTVEYARPLLQLRGMPGRFSTIDMTVSAKHSAPSWNPAHDFEDIHFALWAALG